MAVPSALRRLWPFRRFVVETRLTPAEVAAALAADLDPPALFLASGDRPWIGSVSSTRLEAHRRIGYRNSFLPRVTARIEPADFGARLHVSLAMHPAVTLFVGFWMFGVTLGALGMTFAFLARGGPAGGLGAVLMPLVGAAMVGFGWGLEAERPEEWLRSRLEAPATPRGYRA